MSPQDAISTTSRKDPHATPEMCYHCFDMLLDSYKKTSSSSSSSKQLSPTPDFVHSLPSETVQCPLFVTWEKERRSVSSDHRRYELRGCIGTLSPKPVITSISEYAIISALQDKRFRPVTIAEVPHLRVAVSLLVQYEPCEHCLDWTVGVHGIIVKWTDSIRGVEYSATYLPEVASDQGWDQRTTVESLMRKAGYHGRINETIIGQIQCTRYQSSKCKASFEEYIRARGLDTNLLLASVQQQSSASRSSASSTTCIIS